MKQISLMAAAVLLALALGAQEPPPSKGKIQGLTPQSGFELDQQNNVSRYFNGVMITYEDAVLTADEVIWNERTSEAQAQGNVRLQQGEHLFLGEKLRYNFKTKEIFGAYFRTGRPPFFASGEGLYLDQNRNQYVATNVFITTDDHPGPAQGIRARRMTMVPGEFFEARNATFELGGVPVMYLPYYRRRLSENVNHFDIVPGYRSRFGPFLLGSYNWFWQEQLEGAIHLDWRTKRGLGLGPDLEYDLGLWGQGELRYYYLNDQDPGLDLLGKEINDNRHRLLWSHRTELWSNFTATAVLRYQTDPYVVRDFFEGEYRKNVQPSSFLELHKFWDNFSLNLLVQPRLNDFFDTVERLPDLRITGYRQQLWDSPLYYESESSAGWYRHQFGYDLIPEFEAFRGDTYHKILLPKTFFGWLNITPRIGGRATYYSEAHGPGALTREEERFVFDTGAEASFKASRIYPGAQSRLLEIDSMRHIVEPSMQYAFVPRPGTRPMDLPQFDPLLPSYRLLPIQFPEFNSIDSIDSQNVMRFVLRNRFQTKRQLGIEDFADWAVYADWRLNPGPGQRTYSDLYSDLKFRPRSWIDFRSIVRYGLSEDKWKEFYDRVAFIPHDNWSFSFGHRYLRDDPMFGRGNNLFVTSFYYRMNENWAFRMSHHYEARDGRMEEQYYTLYRDLRSWTTALTLRLRDHRRESDDVTIAFTFSLKAFPRFGLGDDADRPSLLLGY